MGGEKPVRRITNSIRPIVTASLLIKGEARTFWKRNEACHAEG